MAIKVAIKWIGSVSDTVLFTRGEEIEGAFTAHALVFVSPDPTAVQLAAARGPFRTASMTAESTGSSTDTATKDMLRVPYEKILRQASAYVEKMANAANGGAGDVSIIYLATLQPHKEPSPAGVPPAPGDLRLKQGDVSGQLACRADPVTNAASYEWRYATAAAPTTWINGGITTSAKAKLSGLTPGVMYTVQVRAIGSAGPGDWSDPAMLMVI